jgi:hypothetical protein
MNRLRCLWQGTRCEIELELALQSTVPSAQEELEREQGSGVLILTLRYIDGLKERFMNLLKKVVCFVYHADYKGFFSGDWK